MGKYIAFISYRHTEREQRLSLALRRDLEGWRLPKESGLPMKRKVFRDTDELPTSASLGDDIETALRESEWLIALCSEEYVGSLWCRREIEKYIEMGRKDRILPVLVSGTPETSIPEEIRDLAPVADLREAEGRNIQAAAGRCTAALLGRMAGGDPERYAASERRRKLLVSCGVTAAVCAALLGMTFYAGQTADITEAKNREIIAATAEAETAREEAVEERNRAYLASGRYTAEQAWRAVADGNSTEAIRLALSALPEDLHGDLPVSEDAVAALRMAVNIPVYLNIGEYHLAGSMETDFRISGYFKGYSEGDLVLLTEDYYAKQKYLQISSKKITDVASSARAAAVEYGYSFGMVVYHDPSCDYVFFGPEQPLAWKWSKGSKEVAQNRVTLNGEPFYADHIMELGNFGYILAWTEQPRDRIASDTALIKLGENEAVAKLEIAGYPVSADFSYDSFQYRSVAIVDCEGCLTIYDSKTGALTDTIPGIWTRAVFPESNKTICAVDEDGQAFLIDVASHETIAAFSAPAPILDLQYCAESDLYLARCPDGARIYSGDGALKSEYLTGETPAFALWDGYDAFSYAHSGARFLLLYDHRVEVYKAKSNADPELSDIMLFNPDGFRALYSPDGAYVYLISGSAASTDVAEEVYSKYNTRLYKLDAHTGELIWESSRPDNLANEVSRKGDALWRLTGGGMQKIDAETGEELWKTSWFDSGNYDFFRECPNDDINLGFVVNSYNGLTEEHGDLYVFDTQDGELLWTRKDAGIGYWTPEGTGIGCLRQDHDKEAGVTRVWYTLLNAADGTVLKEDYLPFELPYNFRYRRIQAETEADRILLTACSGHGEPFHTKIEMYSLSGGERIQAWELDEVCDPIFSYTGEIATRWTAWEDDTDYCCVLREDGGTGPVIPVNSEAGRKLTTVRDPEALNEKTHPLNASQYILFDREDAAKKDYIYSRTDPTRIIRISDGAVMMNLAFSANDKAAGVTVSPDGNSICITSYKESRIFRITDTDTLVRKARRRLAAEEENER